ncbi:Zn(2)-C6 fungal-type DNA-binding domain protein [Moelleriella libera RCEF 2490]|uniref:Zn(2)-C6 fungal-type DNA-binding domain protein n=1 Tax=Moelleriella libera RCEF 2490 TaxID=1081109 RepID=A0A166RQ06_9HYPO|nr:Zn(2)-C6 fungal-type DNA-binding domain protein [Moelleriella libera RCEF 2490]
MLAAGPGARQACDSCRIRKIRCSEAAPPCAACLAAGIECTFARRPATRGPKKLRDKTLDRIRRGSVRSSSPPHPPPPPAAAAPPPPAAAASVSAVSQIADIIDVYAARLYPLWPIVEAAELRDALLSGSVPPGSTSHRLVEAVALATVEQLKLVTGWTGNAQLCRRRDGPADEPGDVAAAAAHHPLDELRISFFLHVYHENLEGGGASSLLFLREAITHAQILKLERESTYAALSEPDQQLYRRVFWLLFVTERGVALLHKLPAILKSSIKPPWYSVAADRTAQIFPDFLKLVHLFWIFDESGMFDMLRDADLGGDSQLSPSQNCLAMLQQSLQESAHHSDAPSLGSDVQRADVLVTREWMCAVLWRAALRFGIVIPAVNPLDIAKRFLGLVSQIPSSVLESHGPALEFKTFEIATTVVDAMQGSPHLVAATAEHELDRVLHGLRDVLSMSRGGNEKLLSLLNLKMSATATTSLVRQPSPPAIERSLFDDALLAIEDRSSWIYGDYFSQLQLDVPAAEQADSAVRSPTFPRSPSPLTQLLLGAGGMSWPGGGDGSRNLLRESHAPG